MTGLAMTDRHLVIVGAASGIGRQCAILAAREGAILTLMDREPLVLEGDDYTAVRDRLQSVRTVDIADRRDVERAFEEVAAPDAVIVTAAICPIEDWQDEDWDDSFHKVMDVNVLGSINVARAALPKLPAGGGRLVLVGSVAGRMGGLVSGPHYVASKGGVHSLVRWLAQKVAARGICVNGVAPGPTDTAMFDTSSVEEGRIPLGRFATPEEIAWPVLFLASPRASYVTGAVLDVNGGVYVV